MQSLRLRQQTLGQLGATEAGQEPSVEQARESSDEWRFVSHLWAVIGVAPSLSELDLGRAWGHAGPVCSSSAN